MANKTTKVSQSQKPNGRASSTRSVKKDLTRREYKLERKKLDNQARAQTTAAQERTKQVQAIAAAASSTADVIAGGASTASAVKESEKTRQAQLKLISPVLSQTKGNNETEDPETEDGGIKYI